MLKKPSRLLISGILIAFTLNSNVSFAETAPQMTTTPAGTTTDPANLAKVSEAFGNFIGKTLSNPSTGIQFDIENVIKGIREGAAGRPSPISEQEYEKAIAEIQESAFKKLSESNLKAANQFMIDNSKEKGIVTLEPGKLEYLIVKEGTGPLVTDHGSPLINYTGKFLDGTVFGTSDETGPISISLDRTIPGFSKGLVGMKQGEKRRLFIHPDLAYGTRGDLPPNALLIFDVEIVDATPPHDNESSLNNDKDKNDDDDSDDDEDDDDDNKKSKQPKVNPKTNLKS